MPALSSARLAVFGPLTYDLTHLIHDRPENPMRPLLLFLPLLLTLTGCGAKKDAPTVLPPLGSARTLEPGVQEYEVALPRGDGTSRLWIYLPTGAASAKVPCLFVGPAGSHMFDGNGLGEGDRAEHLPYVRAGYAVVAYEVDGELPENANDQQTVDAAVAFKDAHAGLSNARAAVDYALARVPGIDPSRLYAAGHSSAGSLALLVAEYDPRITACIAYAPCCNVPKRLGEQTLSVLDNAIDGERDFLTRSSPNTHPEKVRCPLFLFHADDDSNLPTLDVDAFAAQVQQTNSAVTYVKVPTGNHYQSMIDEGVPRAITWLGTLPAKG